MRKTFLIFSEEFLDGLGLENQGEGILQTLGYFCFERMLGCKLVQEKLKQTNTLQLTKNKPKRVTNVLM